MITPILEVFALLLGFAVLTCNAFMIFKERKDSKKVFHPELIGSKLKDVLMQKHPYMELNYRQFIALLRAAPDQFSFWTLDEGVEGRIKGGKALAIQSVTAGTFHRLNPNQFWEKCDMSSAERVDNLICGGREADFGLVRSEVWNHAICANDNSYWPILITFGGDLTSDCNSRDIVNIPEKATLIFFRNKRDKTKAFDKLFAYIQTKSLSANDAEKNAVAAAKRRLQNSMKGSDNLLRDIAVVKENAEKQVIKTQKEMQKLTLRAGQNCGLKLEVKGEQTCLFHKGRG